MGNSQSSSTDSTRHVFSPSTPINFSPDLISSLESTPETNSSRSKTLDLHIQQRVAEELRKIQDEASSNLAAARKKVADEGNKPSDKDKKAAEPNNTDSTTSNNILNIPSISAKDLLPSSLTEQSDEEKRKQQSSSKVQTQLDQLKQQLSQRKVLNKLPKDVEKARNDVVSCLRVNDRKPLDCWKEVEVFKASVRELEEDFVRKLL